MTTPAPAGTPYPYRIETCDLCLARVIWAITVNGRRMPVDPDVDPVGTVHLTPRAGELPLAAVIGSAAKRFGKQLRVTHFATCRPGQRHLNSRTTP